jgi:hypothetical protein
MTQANNSVSFSAIAANCGAQLIEAKGFEVKRLACLDGVNKGVTQLHAAKVIVGHNKKCAVATAFYDALIAGGLGKGTAANYLTTFRDAVKTGKPVVEWNPAQSKKNKAKGEAKAKGSKAFADLFRPAFNNNEGKTFMALCKQIEKDYKDDKIKTMYAGFVEYFKAEGDEIAE